MFVNCIVELIIIVGNILWIYENCYKGWWLIILGRSMVEELDMWLLIVLFNFLLKSYRVFSVGNFLVIIIRKFWWIRIVFSIKV